MSQQTRPCIGRRRIKPTTSQILWLRIRSIGICKGHGVGAEDMLAALVGLCGIKDKDRDERYWIFGLRIGIYN